MLCTMNSSAIVLMLPQKMKFEGKNCCCFKSRSNPTNLKQSRLICVLLQRISPNSNNNSNMMRHRALTWILANIIMREKWSKPGLVLTLCTQFSWSKLQFFVHYMKFSLSRSHWRVCLIRQANSLNQTVKHRIVCAACKIFYYIATNINTRPKWNNNKEEKKR